VSKILTTNAPNPPHWTPNSYFGAFRTVSLLHELQCKTCRSGASNAQVCVTKSRQNFSQRMHVIHPIGPQTHVLGCFGPFCYCTNFNAKWAKVVQLMHKFVQWSRVGIFSKETQPIHPIGPPNSFFGTFQTILILHKFRCKIGRTGAINAQVHNEVALEFFATNAPDPPHWTPNSCFGAFWTVSLLHEPRCKMGRAGAISPQVHVIKSRWSFLQWTHPIHSIGPQTHILGRFGPFYYYANFGAKWPNWSN
jgi:hypothetical protein